MSSAKLGDLVKRLAALHPRDDDDELTAALSQYDDEQLGFAVAKEKAATLAMRRLARVLPDRVDALRRVPELASRLTQVAASQEQLPRLTAALDEAARRLGVPVWAIKGLAAREWYADPLARDIGCDIDVMVPTVDDAVVLTEWLRGQGYDYARQELPWLKALDGGDIYGQVNLRNDKPGIPSVDIHFGGYSVRHCGHMPLIEAAPEPGLHTYSPTGTMLHVLGNAAGDYFVLAKDLNDLAAALGDDRIDWDVVLGTLHAVALTGFLGYLLDRVVAVQHLDGPARARAAALRARCRPEKPEPARADYWGAAHWRRRWIGTALHAFTLGRRRSLREGIRLGLNAAGYYRQRFSLAVRPDAAPLRLDRLTSWECVRLVPAELATEFLPEAAATGDATAGSRPPGSRDRLGAKIEVVRTSAGDLVETTDTVFIPTIDYRLNEKLVRSVG